VEEGPNWLNREVPNDGRIKFAMIDGINVRNIPKKQYVIWIRSNPFDFLNDFIRKSIPANMKRMKYIPKYLCAKPYLKVTVSQSAE